MEQWGCFLTVSVRLGPDKRIVILDGDSLLMNLGSLVTIGAAAKNLVHSSPITAATKRTAGIDPQSQGGFFRIARRPAMPQLRFLGARLVQQQIGHVLRAASGLRCPAPSARATHLRLSRAYDAGKRKAIVDAAKSAH